MKLEGQVAIVTGGLRGIGEAIALHLATAGVDLVLSSRTLEHDQNLQQEIERLGRQCLICELELSDSKSIEYFVKMAKERFQKIDILINNAGITKDNLLLRMPSTEWHEVMDVNLNGLFYLTKAVLKGMYRQKYGRIVNISSVVGVTGNMGQTNYSASKAGMIGFSKSLAREVANRCITCNVVAPGFIQTAMTDRLSDSQKAKIIEQIPMKKMGSPQDIARAVGFLVSPETEFITGEVLHVNGGMY